MEFDKSELPRMEDLVSGEALVPLFERRLPQNWRVSLVPEGQLRLGPDALITLTPPSGRSALIAVEAKSRLEPKKALQVANQLRGFASGPAMVVAPFLPPRSREAIKAIGVGYADLTGNFYLSIDEPAVFINDRGADSDPWRVSRTIRSLKGPTAGRIVRAMCDFRPPYSIKELAIRSNSPKSSVSRVVAYADTEGLVKKSTSRGVLEVDWRGLIRAWTEDYAVLRSNQMAAYLEPKGVTSLRSKVPRLGDKGLRYAITGSMAGNEYAPYAPAMQAVIYVDNRPQAAEELSLTGPVDHGPNVWLLRPFDSVVFDRSVIRGGMEFAAPSQVAADLLTLPGRSPEEAVELMRWMGENEDAWRT